jgi:hypothetical protein
MSAGGGSPFQDIAKQMMDKNGGAGDSAGALKMQGDACKKLLEKMAQSAQAGKSFFSRAIQMIDQGIAVESSKGPGAPAGPQADMVDTGSGGGMTAPSFPG